MDRKELEIMAPAGSFECLLAAVQGGADSVYFGVGHLNMRSHSAGNFTKEDHIKLGYRYERDGLYIYCEDTGMGILPDKQNVIFDRFVKLDEFSQGTGLGLNICKSITERCGGEIGVKSEGKDKGSTFWVWIPCKQILHS